MEKRSRAAVETRIERLAAGGEGVGRTPEGKVLFVPLAAPGDRVRVRILTSRKRFARGEILEVLERSPDRVEPRCPVFGRCGGCAWQHLDYGSQVVAKAAIVRDALERIGRLAVPDPLTITPSPSPYGYRNRARLLQQGEQVGYRMRRSHQVCGVSQCPVLEPRLEAALEALSVGEQSGAGGGSGGEVKVGSAGEAEWEMTAGTNGRVRVGRIAEDGRPPTAGAIEMLVAGDRLRISQGVFAQGNKLLLEKLPAAVCRAAGTGASCVELFAGAGLLTLPLARRFDVVWAIESNPRATGDLRANLERAGVANTEVRTGPVEEELAALALASPDVLVLDPPRAGVPADAMDTLVSLRPGRVVYLSCDPATLARDAKMLTENGYELTAVEAFDLFPQTPHVEALATLERVRPG